MKYEVYNLFNGETVYEAYTLKEALTFIDKVSIEDDEDAYDYFGVRDAK